MDNIGLDVGFGFTKVFTGDRLIKFPSVVGSFDEPAFLDAGIKLPKNGNGRISVNGSPFLVGDDAIRDSMRIFTWRERDWIDTPAYSALVKYALNLTERKSGEPYRIVTGLPVAHYKKCKDRLAKTILEIAGPKTDVRVILQPIGSYLDCLLDNDANIRDKNLLNGAVGIIDIGFFTMDFITMRKLRFVKDSYNSCESGLATAYSSIAKAIYDLYDLKKEVYEMERVVKDGFIRVFGEKKDVRPIVDYYLDTMAAEIKARARHLWQDESGIDMILLTGGGASVLRDRLMFYHYMKIVNDAQSSNTKGFYKFGRRLEYDV